MTNDPTIPTKTEIENLAQWAEAGEFDPNFASGMALHGAAAAAAGRAMLEAAGVDVDAVERAVGGRPQLDPAAPRGAPSPRVNVAIPETMDEVLKAKAKARGVRTSVLVREALARSEDVAALVRAEGRYAWPVPVDLCDDQQVEALVAKAESLVGPHILVNNAGGWGTGDHQFPISPRSEWNAVLDLNLRAPTLSSSRRCPGRNTQPPHP